jgi:Type IX secretion system protein PorV
MKPALLLALFISLAATAQAGIDANAGTASFAFLKIGAGARPVAMGGAYVGVAEGANGLYWNPGGLVRLQGKEFSATYMNYLVGMQSGYVAYAQPWRKNAALGLSVNYLNGGQVQETTVDNPTGVGLSKFSPGDMAVQLTYAQSLSPALSVGLGMKWIRETIKTYSAMGFALDLGAFYQPHIQGLTLGGSVSNLGKKTKAMISEKEPLPLVLRAGLGYRIPRFKDKVLLALEADKPSDNKLSFHLGGEARVHRYADLRAGYSSTGSDLKTSSDVDWLAGLSFGLGTHFKNYRLDYAFTPYVDLGNAQRLTLGVRF